MVSNLLCGILRQYHKPAPNHSQRGTAPATPEVRNLKVKAVIIIIIIKIIIPLKCFKFLMCCVECEFSKEFITVKSMMFLCSFKSILFMKTDIWILFSNQIKLIGHS